MGDATAKLLAINTFKGLYSYRRLSFGVKPAASIFQSLMDKILEGLEKVQCYIDEILIWSSTLSELYDKVRLVLTRLEDYNVKVN